MQRCSYVFYIYEHFPEAISLCGISIVFIMHIQDPLFANILWTFFLQTWRCPVAGKNEAAGFVYRKEIGQKGRSVNSHYYSFFFFLWSMKHKHGHGHATATSWKVGYKDMLSNIYYYYYI